MKVNLSQLIEGKTETINLEFDYALDNINKLNYDVIKLNPFHFSGRIIKQNDKVSIDLSFSSQITFRCSRCINEFKKIVSGSLKNDVELTETPSTDLDGFILDRDILDLTDLIEEAIVLSLPMKVICSEECKGLCYECGINLNFESCNCSNERIDPRFEKLKDFFQSE